MCSKCKQFRKRSRPHAINLSKLCRINSVDEFLMHKLESFDMGESMERFSYFLLINLRMANRDEINEIKGNIKLIRLKNALLFKLRIRQEQPLMMMSHDDFLLQYSY